jgi:DNA-binding transcriptional ArsR family regulator
MVKSKNIHVCSSTVIHQDLVDRARKTMPPDTILYDLADLFKVFGDTMRIKILHALLSSEMCVCDISALLNMTESAISHQLRVLKQAHLVKQRKSGKVVYYSLTDNHVESIVSCGLDHIGE